MKKASVIALVVVFLVADLVLVILARQHVSSPPEPVGLPMVASTVQPSDSVQKPFAFDPAQAATLSVSNDDTLLLAGRGQCDGKTAGTLSVSLDGGKRLSEPSIPLREFLAVKAANASNLSVVGASADCTPRQFNSTDGGVTWHPTRISLWFPHATRVDTVVTSSGASKPGCAVVTSLSQLGADFGRVACADGNLFGTGNGGTSWTKMGRLDNLRAINFSSFSNGQALASFEGCAAQLFSTRDSGRTWIKGGCITGDPAQALAVNDVSITASVGGSLYRSTDSGLSFRQP